MSLVRRAETHKFLDKVAAVKGMLGSNPANFPNELLGMLYQQHTFISEYAANVQITSQDDAAGYLYGVFVIRPMSVVPNPEAPSVRIPIVVAGRRAFPFDVFITADGKFQPLTQTRVTSALFHSSPFQAVPRSSLPAQAQVGGSGFPGTGEDLFQSARYGQTKVSSILASVLGTVSEQQVEDFLQQVSGTPELLAGMREHPAFSAAIKTVALTKEAARFVEEARYPVASLLEKSAEGFTLTTALADDSGAVVSFEPVVLSRALVDTLPLLVKQAALECGHVLLTDCYTPLPEVSSDTDALDKVAMSTETGVYAVVDANAVASRVGVVSGITTFEGRKLDRVLVLSETGTEMHEKVAGLRCGDFDLSLAQGTAAQGRGVFIIGNTVTEPFTVESTVVGATAEIRGHTDVGSRYLLKSASVKKLTPYADNALLLPEEAIFLPLHGSDRYQTDPAKTKIASAIIELSNSVELRVNNRGGVDVTDSYGNELSSTQNSVATEMLLLAMGDSAQGAFEKVAKLAAGKVSCLRIVPARSVELRKKEKRASAKAPEVAEVRQFLVKEASVLAAPDTVDAVLSLGFVTDENIATYVEYLPTFEDALSKLAETLIGTRIGVPDIPENAVTSSMNGLEKAIQGLKKLQIRLSLPTDEQSFN